MFTEKRTNRRLTNVIRKAQLNLGSGELKLPGLTPPGWVRQVFDKVKIKQDLAKDGYRFRKFMIKFMIKKSDKTPKFHKSVGTFHLLDLAFKTKSNLSMKMCMLLYLIEISWFAVFETRKHNNNADESQIRFKDKTFKSIN